MDQPVLPNPEQPLRLIAILHYVMAGFRAVFGFGGLIFLVIGIVFVCIGDSLKDSTTGEPMPWFGWIFVGVGLVWMILAFGWAWVTFMSARHIGRRTGRMFSLIVAAIECVSFPLGTALGIFTIIILTKPEVKELYGEIPPPA